MARRSITQDQLKELLHYNPVSGDFVWSKHRRGVKFGTVAGYINYSGYWLIRINDKNYRAHRLAFLYMNGSFPAQEVDHINGIRTDNSFLNLREIDRVGNMQNTKIYSTNTSNIMGVAFFKDRGRWRADININKKLTIIGQYRDFFEAVCARKSAENKYNFHPNHGRIA